MMFLMLFGVISGRIYSIQHNSSYLVADMQFSRSAILAKSRGYIYDVNMKPLVNVFDEDCYVMLSNSYTNNFIGNLSTEIKDGVFVVMKADNEINENDYIKSFSKSDRYSDNLCAHIIGYTDSSGHGVCGIEKAFDRILSEASGSLSVEFNCDANSNVLSGDGLTLIDNNYDSPAGIRLTIDRDIQYIAQQALAESSIEKGAVVILDSSTAEIRAIASVPTYDVNNLEKSLQSEIAPFLNRALSSYPVGSVFKPVIAAAALENGYSISASYQCDGCVEINGNTFSCFDYKQHGQMNLNKAIEKSCNTFFIDLGIKTGAEEIYETAVNFGFSNRISLCSTLVGDSGYLPRSEELSSDAAIANLCFGQGSLLSTPLQLAAAYNVFANKGIYIEPIILKELIDENSDGYAYYKSEIMRRVITEDACNKINDCLYNNMLNGTGTTASSDFVTAAGKTATAQTGRYDTDGKELLCTWFCGFFPFENPQYTIVVFNEEGSSASADCAPVFKYCTEEIYKLTN